MTALIRDLSRLAAVLLRAAGDGFEEFVASVTWQLTRVPEFVDDSVDDGSAL